MKKSSKQNNKNKQRKAKDKRRQQRKRKAESQLADAQAINADGTAPQTPAQKRAALLAQHRKTQWQQKVKAGKAAPAKVEKRYNRGG